MRPRYYDDMFLYSHIYAQEVFVLSSDSDETESEEFETEPEQVC